jgi:hypothetical protein
MQYKMALPEGDKTVPPHFSKFLGKSTSLKSSKSYYTAGRKARRMRKCFERSFI